MPEDLRIYPQSSPDGTPIPFDIGLPYGIFIAPIAVAASSEYALPTDVDLVAVMEATCSAVISYDGLAPSITEGALLSPASIVSAGASVSVYIPKGTTFQTKSLDGSSTGKLYISLFTPWEGLTKAVLGRVG